MGEKRFEWVEIIEPSRHEHMFANLITGQCLWDPPDGVDVKPTHENQWWELFDTNTGRYYYYNATSQETVWHKPKDGDIIPLSKLQMLKTRESSHNSTSSLKKLRNESNFNNNNTEVTCNTTELNEGMMLSAHSEDKLHVGDQEQTLIKGQEMGSSLKSINKQHILTSPERRSQSISLSTSSDSSVLNGKRATLPRTLTVDPAHHQRPAIKDKPKYNSLRSKAPPKPPRMTVNVTDPHSNDTISISVEKTIEYDETSHNTKKGGNIAANSTQISVTRSPKMTNKMLGKSKSSPIASVSILPSNDHTSSQDSKLFISTPNSISDERPSSVQYSTSSHQPSIFTTSSNAISSRYSTFSNVAMNEVNNSLELANISNSSDYAVPIKSRKSEPSVTPKPAEYAVPVKKLPKEEHPSCEEHKKYNVVITSDTVTDCDIEPVTNNISSQDVLPDYTVIPPTPTTSGICGKQVSKGHILPDLKTSPVPHEYALITEIDSMNDKNMPRGMPPSPEFPTNVIPVPPPPPKVTPRKQLPSMYDNVEPGSLTIYDNSSENEEFNETFNSADSTSPHACHLSGSSDESFDPIENNLLGTESPDGNYFDKIDGLGRRSCATLPSPLSPRKLPKIPLDDDHGTPPTKRNPLVRMKSDPLVDTEKRIKISKTIESIQSTFRPISMLNLSSNIASITNKHKRSVIGSSESDIPEQVPLSTHRTGILRRRMSIHSMLSWSKTCIKKPMVLTRDKSLRKEAVDVFKSILMCMGDKSTRKNHESVCVDIVTKGWTTPQLRDEIYIQLCKQTTGNKKLNSLKQGWELLTACLSIFPPSNKFHSYLEGYISRHLDSEDEIIIQANVIHYAKYCYKQLERICQTGAKRGLKGPTVEEINAAIKRVFNPSMFGNTLEDVIEMQKDKFPDHQLPWILTTLTESVLLQNGLQTEGIFRVPGDIDDVNQLKLMVDNWQAPEHKSDPTVPASLLKLWFRDLYEPLIPQRYYDQCIHNCDNPDISLNIIQSLPPVNKLIFSYLIRLLQAFLIPENVSKSKMDENNLAMVWAPNCLRCPSDDPREIFENTRKEMTFLRNVLKVLDTSFLEGVV